MTQPYHLDGQTLTILQDVDPEDPREWDNLGTMVCWHRRYTLGDKHDFATSKDFATRVGVRQHKVIMLPVFGYDHSGLSVSTSRVYPFNDPWDAGQLGYIYTPRAKVREEFHVKRISPALLKRVLEILRSEVATYNQYLNGDVWGFVVKDDKSGEVVDSCFGFFGSILTQNGMLEHLDPKWHELLRAA